MFCPIPKVLYNKNVNTIPSSCIYKLSQSSNHEIGDYFYNESIAQNYAFWFLWNFQKHFDYNCKDPHVLAIQPINFLFNAR
jgi:hypothetical protein